MWFGKIDKLSSYIFHRAEMLTGLIEVLYSHTIDDTWDQRLQHFSPFTCNGRTFTKSKYADMIDNFNETGVMEGPLLVNLLEKETILPTDVSLEILKLFHLIHSCGPSDELRNEKYIIPYFAKQRIEAPAVYDHLIPLRVDLYLRGLPLPNYIYSLITAAYLDMNSDPYNIPQAGMNGATVTKGNKRVKYFLHNATENCVTLITLSPLKRICEAWQDHLSSFRQLISELKSVWKGVRYESVFVCSHCLLANKPTPTTVADPDWFNLEYAASDVNICYTGTEITVCGKDLSAIESESVPYPLMNPCK
jgi:hypothetical protein